MVSNAERQLRRTPTPSANPLPVGPKIAFTGGLDFNDHRLIWDKLDKVHAKHPDMAAASRIPEGRRTDRRQMGDQSQGAAART
jgi:hypothetical protein